MPMMLAGTAGQADAISKTPPRRQDVPADDAAELASAGELNAADYASGMGYMDGLASLDIEVRFVRPSESWVGVTPDHVPGTVDSAPGLAV